MAEKIISPGVFSRENDKSIITRGPVVTGAAIVGPTTKGRPLVPTVVTSYSEYQSVFGEKFKSGSQYYEYLTSIAAKEYFEGGGESLLVTRIVSGSTYDTYATSSVPMSGSTSALAVSSSFELEVLAFGDSMNNSGSFGSNGTLNLGTTDNLRWEISSVDYTNGNFNLLIRSGNDSSNNTNVLETYTNLSLDPSQPNFISRVIGDKKPIYIAESGAEEAYVKYTGEYENASNYVRIKSVNNLLVDSIDNNGDFKSSTYKAYLPNLGSGSIGGAFGGGVADTSRVQNMYENISALNNQGFTTDEYELGLRLLANKDEYDFNLLAAPGLFMNSLLISTCATRGDSFAIVDPVIYGSTKAAVKTAALSSSSNYAAVYWPWVQIYSSVLGKTIWVPASTVMLGVYSYNDNVGQRWFAPAGLNRGGIGSVVQAEKKVSSSNRDDLYESNVNVLASFPGEGVVAFGQRTLQKNATSLRGINVRRLLIDLKRFIGNVGRTIVFEPNTTVTRNKFLNVVNPYLESVVQREGLYSYRVKMDDENNTGDVIDRNQLYGQVIVQPVRSAEFIVLDFTLQATGAEFPS